jgi:putative holliday junction resolvase
MFLWYAHSMSRVLGIDYGEKRVGIALSDAGRTFAFPRCVLQNSPALLDTIARMVEDENISYFVLGESDNPQGGMNTIMRRISIFGAALKVRTGLPVEFMSEAYSSAEARRALKTSIKNRKEAPAVIDAAAAAIILQTHLDAVQHTTSTG